MVSNWFGLFYDTQLKTALSQTVFLIGSYEDADLWDGHTIERVTGQERVCLCVFILLGQSLVAVLVKISIYSSAILWRFESRLIFK